MFQKNDKLWKIGTREKRYSHKYGRKSKNNLTKHNIYVQFYNRKTVEDEGLKTMKLNNASGKHDRIPELTKYMLLYL